jgi:acyl-coenzyme A thioesterase PaaI-like protein
VAAPTYVVPGSDELAAAVRRLVDAVVRTQVEPDVVAAATHAVRDVTASLAASLRDGPYSPDLTSPFSNPLSAVGGRANPLAPPVELIPGPEGVQGRFRVGSPYEGPPGLVHGGILALVLDHVLGQAALAAGHGGMTVSLEVRYLAPTPLDTDLVAEGRLDRVDGRKIRMVGSVSAGDTNTVEATGLFLALDEDTAAALFPHLAAG